MSSGPPPVPGGRSPEEREAARREREARRAAREGGTSPQAAPPPDNTPVREPAPAVQAATDGRRDWLADARRLARSEAGGGTVAAGGQRGGRSRASGGRRRGPGRLIAIVVLLAIILGIAWFANCALPAVQGRRRRDGQGHDPAGLEPVADRGSPGEGGRGRGRRLLPAPRPARRPQRRPPAGLVRAPQGHELHGRARRAAGGRAAQRGAGGDPRGPLAHRDQAAHQGPPRATTSGPAAARASSTRPITRHRAARASRGSSSRPPTS